MITLSSKNYTADAIRLSQLLSNTTIVNMLKVCKKFDLALQGKKGPSATFFNLVFITVLPLPGFLC